MSDFERRGAVIFQAFGRRGQRPPTVDGGGDGGDDDGMDARISKLEAIIPTLATKTDLATMGNDLIKWVVGTAVGISVAAITIITFVLNNATPKAAPPQPQPPAIIINVPSQTSPPAPVAPPPKP